MIPKIAKAGSRTYGVLAYLYGPGRRDEHIDPHLVTSWDGTAPDPGRDPGATLTQLQQHLDLPVLAVAPDERPTHHVWHCSVRTAPDDRALSEREWAQAARRVVAATGIAPADDPHGCRWVAIRHADDHIHIIATLMRHDGTRPRDFRSGKRAQAECRQIEQEWGLRQLNPGDGTAAQPPTSAERFKAERHGHQRTPREELRERVRQAVAGASSEEEFFTRLTEAGLRITKRHAPSGDATGYSVALPGDRNRHGEPIWFAGSTLAPDLSLPKIRQRLPTSADTGTWPPTSGHRSAPARARYRAVPEAETAAAAFRENNEERAAAHLIGVGELLDAVTHTSTSATREHLGAAARAFERATRSHVRAQQSETRALRSAARGIARAGTALGRGEDGGATAMLLSTLVLVAIAAAHWHAARGHAQQAAAAHAAAEHLRAAYRTASTAPMTALRQQGRLLLEAVRERHAASIDAALGERGASIRDEPGYDALTATLDQAERAGYRPESLLEQAVELRELGTADSVSDVLVWRLRRLANLPARADAPSTAKEAGHPVQPARPSPAPGPPPSDPRPRTPRR